MDEFVGVRVWGLIERCGLWGVGGGGGVSLVVERGGGFFIEGRGGGWGVESKLGGVLGFIWGFLVFLGEGRIFYL